MGISARLVSEVAVETSRAWSPIPSTEYVVELFVSPEAEKLMSEKVCCSARDRSSMLVSATTVSNDNTWAVEL